MSNYKYSKMINKSLSLLNKFYSAKTKLFKMAIRAMVCNNTVTAPAASLTHGLRFG